MGIILNYKTKNKWEEATHLPTQARHLHLSSTLPLTRAPVITINGVRTTSEVETLVLVPLSVSKTFLLLASHPMHLFMQPQRPQHTTHQTFLALTLLDTILQPMHQLLMHQPPMHQLPTLQQPTHQAHLPIMLRP